MSTTDSNPSSVSQARGESIAASRPQGSCLRTADIFGKKREIAIEHVGVYYRLRITRANKLILTK